jgi:polyisoprenoid-binding protein YceI
MRSVFAAFFLVFSSVVVWASGGNPDGKVNINLETSKIDWKGYKVLGQHDGYIKFKSGNFVFDNGNLVGGEFVVDMSSLVCTDLSGKGKDNLEGHLKSDDFFGVSAFPTSSLKITKVVSRGKPGEYKVTANLTIKSTSKEIKFNATVLDGNASAAIKVDRSEYDIRYGSGSFFDSLGDKTIYDEFDLNINVKY